MNEFEQAIVRAQKRYWFNRINRFAVVAVLVIVFVVVALLLRFVDSIRVVVGPEEIAETATIEITDGYAFKWSPYFWVVNRTATVNVKAPGFAEQLVEVPDAAFSRGLIDIILQELSASLNASTNPSMEGTTWYLNDVLVSNDSNFQTELPAGTYTLTARHPYFVPSTTELVVERGQNYAVTQDFEKISLDVVIISEPHQAIVEVDSKPIGSTPLSTKLDGGEHSITLSLPNYQPITDTIRVTEHENDIKRYYEFQKQAVPLAVTLKPEGGVFELDGLVKSAASIAKVRLTVNTTHKVRYSKPGYAAKEFEFTVSPKSPNNIRIELQEEFGIVDFRSEPSATVQIGNRTAGRTPLSLSLQTVSQDITFVEDGYIPVKSKVTPDSSAPKLVSVTLETEKAYRIKNAPAQYKNSVGIELKLFNKPDAFVMGSRRGEAGSRSNEFERTVQLTRPFYAGMHEVTFDQVLFSVDPQHTATGDRMPATGLPWTVVAKYCNWLSEKEGFEPVYEFDGNTLLRSNSGADGYRLLTEAEWEWLARKANRKKQTQFPWGDQNVVPANSGNLADESAKESVPVYIKKYKDGKPAIAETGSFPPEASGLYDLVGNAREWTHDPYNLESHDPNSIQVNPFDESGQRQWHTVKGSSWRSAQVSELRGAWRGGSNSAQDDLGFRIARYLYKE